MSEQGGPPLNERSIKQDLARWADVRKQAMWSAFQVEEENHMCLLRSIASSSKTLPHFWLVLLCYEAPEDIRISHSSLGPSL